MGFIQREIDRLAMALREELDEKRYTQLYAAQQALAWALEPGGIKYPYDEIMGTEASEAGYLLKSYPLVSSETCDRFETQ